MAAKIYKVHRWKSIDWQQLGADWRVFFCFLCQWSAMRRRILPLLYQYIHL